MNITVEKLPRCMASVRVEVPGETRTATREGILKTYVQRAVLPGFRRGKAPRSVIEKRFHDDIERETNEQLANKGLEAAVEQEKFHVLAVTAVEPQSDGFTLQLVLAPEFELPDYKRLPISVPRLEITDEHVDRVIEQQRERQAELVDVDRPAQEGDFVTIDYHAAIDGQPLRDQLPEAEVWVGENENYVMKLADDSFFPDFCAQLAGATKGETREVTITMPAEGVNPLIAGAAVTYAVTVHAIQEAVLPPLDDELAARIMEGKTMEALRTHVRTSLESDASRKEHEHKRAAAMMALRELTHFDLPEHLVKSAAQRRAHQLVQANLERGIEQQLIEENEKEILSAAAEQAETDVKDEFILMQIVDREKLTVTQQDMARRISAIALQANAQPQRVMRTLQKNDGLGSLRHSILLGKALDVLVEHADIEYTAAPEVEVTA